MRYLKIEWAVLFGLSLLVGCGDETKEIYETWMKASELFEEGKIREAEFLYRKLSKLCHDNKLKSKVEERLRVCQEILSTLEQVKGYEASGKYELALKECERIRPLNPIFARQLARKLQKSKWENEIITVFSGKYCSISLATL